MGCAWPTTILKFCQEKILHTITLTSWVHEFMPNTLTSACFSRNLNLPDKAFIKPVPNLASDFCSWVTGVKLYMVSWCCSPSPSRFDVLWVQRCFLFNTVTKSHLNYHNFPVISTQYGRSPLTSDLSKLQVVSAFRTATFFSSIRCKF